MQTMVTRKLATPGARLGLGLVASLAAHQAAAAEELIVYGNQTSLQVRLEPAAIRADIDNYVNSLNEQLRAKLTQEVKSLLQPRLVLAGEEAHTRG